MKRGDIYYADLNPTIGSEISKSRPVIIVTNDVSNKYGSVLAVVPITSNVRKLFPFDVYLAKENSLLKKDSKATCEHIRSIDKSRIIGNRVGKLLAEEMKSIDRALKLHLGL